MKNAIVRISYVLLLVFTTSVQSVAAQENQENSLKLERARSLLVESRKIKEEEKTQNAGNARPWRQSVKEQELSLSGAGFKMLTALGLCVGVLLIVLHLVKKYAPKSVGLAGRRMRLIEKLSVTSKTSLILAQVEGRRVLFSVGPEQVQFYEAGDGIDQVQEENVVELEHPVSDFAAERNLCANQD